MPLKAKSIHAIENEAASRKAIVDFDYALPPQLPGRSMQLCQFHINFYNSGKRIDQSILKRRALMPLCKTCVAAECARLNIPASQINVPSTGYSIDHCVCAYNLLNLPGCYYCSIEFYRGHALEYINIHGERIFNADGSPRTIHLYCKCPPKAVNPYVAPEKAQPMDFATGGEVLRLCCVCDQVVGVPAHQLDGVTHLGLPIRLPSVAVDASGPGMLGSREGCKSVHPLIPPSRLRG